MAKTLVKIVLADIEIHGSTMGIMDLHVLCTSPPRRVSTSLHSLQPVDSHSLKSKLNYPKSSSNARRYAPHETTADKKIVEILYRYRSDECHHTPNVNISLPN
ncbi:hypothetical protein QTP88_003647 [Uroleucon formosanum]